MKGAMIAKYDSNLREYWCILKKRKLLVIFSTFVLGPFSVVFDALKAPTRMTPPIAASGLIGILLSAMRHMP
jgi:hypothetical protein